MVTLPWDGVVEARDGVAVVVPAGRPVGELVDRLAAGAPPPEVAREFGLDAAGVVAALAFDALGDDRDEAGPPLVQCRPRRAGLGAALAEGALAGLFPRAARPARLALAAGLLQVHDFWDASHHAAQEADDLGEAAVSAYWHGVAHRREPDPGNASYWFRRVGRHPLFGPLAAAARPSLGAAPGGPALADRLTPRGSWDPFAFITYCDTPGARDDALARRLQRLEMALLLRASLPEA